MRFIIVHRYFCIRGWHAELLRLRIGISFRLYLYYWYRCAEHAATVAGDDTIDKNNKNRDRSHWRKWLHEVHVIRIYISCTTTGNHQNNDESGHTRHEKENTRTDYFCEFNKNVCIFSGTTRSAREIERYAKKKQKQNTFVLTPAAVVGIISFDDKRNRFGVFNIYSNFENGKLRERRKERANWTEGNAQHNLSPYRRNLTSPPANQIYIYIVQVYRMTFGQHILHHERRNSFTRTEVVSIKCKPRRKCVECVFAFHCSTGRVNSQEFGASREYIVFELCFHLFMRMLTRVRLHSPGTWVFNSFRKHDAMNIFRFRHNLGKLQTPDLRFQYLICFCFPRAENESTVCFYYCLCLLYRVFFCRTANIHGAFRSSFVRKTRYDGTIFAEWAMKR